MKNYNIVIFGTGISSEKVLNAIKEQNATVVCFADNNFNKHGKLHHGVSIVNPKELATMDYDYILVAIIKFPSVKKQLLEMGIPEDKIIPYFDLDSMDLSCFEDIIDSGKFLRDNYEIKFQRLTIQLTNMPYEIAAQQKLFAPKVLGIESTIDYLVNTNASISRFGDGEIKLIAGKDIGFQKASPEMAARLKEVLKGSVENHVVGILNVFGDLSDYTEELQDYFRSYLYDYNREFQYALLNPEKTYYDAFITRPYISYKNKTHAAHIFTRFKELWKNKEIVIVEGDRTRLGRGNDLFDNVKSCERIICPNENAFEQYDAILSAIMKQEKNKMILLALGPTATVLAYDLAKAGYRALDIGHIDIEYEWYRMGATEKVAVKNKYTNEAYGGNSTVEYVDEEYEKQIVGRIC